MRLHMHPISVLENIWKRLFLLLIPLIRGVAFIFSPEGFRAWLSGAWLDILVILFILTASYINWRCKTYQVEANQLIIRTGVLIRRESCIPKKAIATLSESIPFYIRPFRAVRVYVDTDGGLAQRVDVKLTVREKDMPVLQQLQDAKPVAPFLKRGYSPRWYEVAFMSICVSSALGSAVYAALFIRQAGKIFGEDILELLRFRLEHAAEYLIFIPQTAAILAIVILGLWFLGFMRNYLYYMKFSVYRQGDRLMLRHGLFVRSESVCRVNHINFIDRRQNLLSRMFRLNMVFIQCTGYGKVQQKMAAVIPAATNKATRIYLKLLLPEFQETPVQIRPMRRSAVRYLWSPLAGITAVIAVFYFILPWLIPWLNKIKNSQCLFKELFRPRSSGCQCGRCSQDHKGMCITLFIGNNATLLCHTCIPATIFVIVKLSPKTFQRRIHKLSASFMAKHQSQAVYMCHAAGDPGFPVSVLPWCSVVPQIIGTSIR